MLVSSGADCRPRSLPRRHAVAAGRKVLRFVWGLLLWGSAEGHDRLHIPAPFVNMSQVAVAEVVSIGLDGVGHHAAKEAPDRLAPAIVDFIAGVDAG
jgi:hypothetical protein